MHNRSCIACTRENRRNNEQRYRTISKQAIKLVVAFREKDTTTVMKELKKLDSMV